MNNDAKILVAAAFVLSGLGAAVAGTGTYNATAGSGLIFDVVTDGSGHFGPMFAICDGAALAACATLTGNSLNVNLTNGVGSTGSAVPSTGAYEAGQARSSEPTAATNGNLTGVSVDLTGKVINSPYANRENMVRGSASATTTGATTLIAAGAGSLKNYITSVECGRDDAGTTAIHVTFSDAASTVLVIPNNGGGGGNNQTFPVPLATAATTAFTFTASNATTTVYCSAQGFQGY